MSSNAKKLSPQEAREFLALTRDDITLDFMRENFACIMGNDAPKYNTYDKITIPRGRFPGQNETIESTLGRFIVNLVVIPESYHLKHGYCNEELTKGAISSIESKMGDMVLNDEMTVKEYADYLDYGEWISMGTVNFLGPTMDYDINIPIPEVIKRRDELFEKYKKEIKRGESAIAEKIEKELLNIAKKKIKEKKNPAYDFFESGVGSFANNYKKTSIMAGAIENPYTKKLDILKSNYIDGIDINEYSKFSNLTLIGGYSRGVATQTSGYQRKKIDNAVQSVVLDEAGTDCGTKYTLDIEILPDFTKLFTNRYIVEDGKLILLTKENITKYVGKVVHMRSPMFCKSQNICNKCAGELFYKMGVKNAGLLNSSMSGVLMNASMKKFHDATIKFNRIDIEKFIKNR